MMCNHHHHHHHNNNRQRKNINNNWIWVVVVYRKYVWYINKFILNITWSSMTPKPEYSNNLLWCFHFIHPFISLSIFLIGANPINWMCAHLFTPQKCSSLFLSTPFLLPSFFFDHHRWFVSTTTTSNSPVKQYPTCWLHFSHCIILWKYLSLLLDNDLTWSWWCCECFLQSHFHWLTDVVRSMNDDDDDDDDDVDLTETNASKVWTKISV